MPTLRTLTRIITVAGTNENLRTMTVSLPYVTMLAADPRYNAPPPAAPSPRRAPAGSRRPPPPARVSMPRSTSAERTAALAAPLDALMRELDRHAAARM